ETLAYQATLTIATVGVEAIADYRFAVANHIGVYRNEACRHVRKIDIGVAYWRCNAACILADIHDANAHLRLRLWAGDCVQKSEQLCFGQGYVEQRVEKQVKRKYNGDPGQWINPAA